MTDVRAARFLVVDGRFPLKFHHIVAKEPKIQFKNCTNLQNSTHKKFGKWNHRRGAVARDLGQILQNTRRRCVLGAHPNLGRSLLPVALPETSQITRDLASDIFHWAVVFGPA